jgi:hypothetical protein
MNPNGLLSKIPIRSFELQGATEGVCSVEDEGLGG